MTQWHGTRLPCFRELIHVYDMTHSHVWHDLLIRVTWLSDMARARLASDGAQEAMMAMRRCVAVCCSVLHVLQCVAVYCSVLEVTGWSTRSRDGYAKLRCSVLQCVAVCCSVLQCVAGWSTRGHDGYAQVCCSVLQCVTVYCSMLHCVTVCCGGLQAMHSNVFMCMACDTYQMSHATHVKISRHSRDWIMSHIWIGTRVLDGSCHTHSYVWLYPLLRKRHTYD